MAQLPWGQLGAGQPAHQDEAELDLRRAIELAASSSAECVATSEQVRQVSKSKRSGSELRRFEEEEGEAEESRPTVGRPGGSNGLGRARRGRRRWAGGSNPVPTWSKYVFPTVVGVTLYLVISSLSNARHQHLYQVHAFNVDAQSAVVQAGPEGSYFGYSVAQHRDRGHNWLLVGAPRAKTDQPGTQQAGAVYRCSATLSMSCQQIPFDRTGASTIQLKDKQVATDDKSFQWFGASLQSAQDNGSIVACAPSYVYYTNTLRRREPVGSCRFSRGSFDGFFDYSPCRIDEEWGHQRLGSCQAGFASAITKDGSRLFVAAPGAHAWQGQVFAHNLRTDLSNSTSGVNPYYEDDAYLGYSLALGRFSSNASSPAATPADADLAIGIPRANELAGKVMLVNRHMATLRNISGEQVGSYFGYALATADLNGDGLDDLLIGAPLYYNSTNSHREAHFERGRVYVALANARHELAIVQRLDGQRNRARFGTALANAGDLNRDGYQDLAVGAPYDGPDGHGAVYIYMGRKSGLSQHHDQVIYAESVGRLGEGAGLRAFGFAISAGLDMDANQYPDLLVGDYAASRAVLLRSRPVVSLTSSLAFQPDHFNLDDKTCLLSNASISVACVTVQYCLKYTGLNVDERLAFVHDIKLDTENKGAPRLFFLAQEGKSEARNTSILQKDVERCHAFKAYVMRQIRDKLTPLKVDIEYNLAEQLAGSTGYESRLRPVLNRPQQQQQQQQGLTGGNRLSKLASIQKNCGPDNVCVPDLKLTMALNRDSYTMGSNEKIVLEVTVRNNGEDAFESMFYLTMPMTVEFNHINKTRYDYPVCYGAKPEQTGENVLTCDLGNPQARNDLVKFSVIMEPARNGHFHSADFTFAGQVNSTNPELDKRHLEDNRVVVGIPINVEYQLVLNGNSQPRDWIHNTTLQRRPAPAAADEPPASPTRPAYFSEADLGPEVYHTYQLQNRGPSNINDIALTILWPSRTKDGADYLLYLVDEPQTSDKVRCKPAPDELVNPLKLKYLRGNSVGPPAVAIGSGRNYTKAGQVARFVRQTAPDAAADDDDDQKPKALAQLASQTTSSVDESVFQQLNSLTCGPNQCTRFDCNVYDLAKNDIATIKIRSRLVEETVSKLALPDFVISSRMIAQIKKLPYNVSVQSIPPYSYKVETQVLTTGLAVQDLLPWWLVALAILLGLLLFILLACFLKYLGFFARKRPPKTAEREPLTPTIWNDYQYTPGDTAL